MQHHATRRTIKAADGGGECEEGLVRGLGRLEEKHPRVEAVGPADVGCRRKVHVTGMSACAHACVEVGLQKR